ncbi:MAG TPA: D-alanyl-D-alanine carboxypeptidase/D-alanyl-D-alanine-endopeptidase [Tepidisphaeraceae bacterium]|jgi:D-alanyl-D-alanine carboxypeptidase/D-alanyl-D-alanine-endopeptidase (penicillin-binding protein 4)|nr:D-alanyl-D-alanine carboxypeptidase/D-alanyl-D-alanine-endopeptidase [Tepidisphaeraceae bacterium]
MKLLTRVVCWMGCGVLAVGGTPPVVRADLASDVQVVLQDKLLRKASVGVEVFRLGKTQADVKEIYNLRADVPLTPASNLKLATSSAALDTLGPEFRFRTVLLLHDGDLVLIGDGDPTFGDAEYLKKAGWKVTTVFQNWAEQLKKLNIASVRNVIVDDSIFDENFAHSRWPARQYTSRFEAEVAGMNLNANCVDFTVQPTAPGQAVAYAMDPPTAYVTVKNGCVTGNSNGIRLDRKPEANDVALGGETPSRGLASVSITVHDAPMYAATVLGETVAEKGIKVTGQVKRDRTQRQLREKAGPAAAGWTIIGIHETPILPVLARCNKDSMNLYAESLCKRLGYESTHASGSWESGTAAVGAFLKKAGIPEPEFKLDDGSGLSRADAISPHGLARVLTYDYYGKNHDLFFSTLSVAGVDGTLDDRFRNADVRDLRRRVVGKSGFIEGVSTISGYLKARDEQWYAFSIMMNGIPHLSNSEIKQLQEKIIKAVDNSTVSASARG